jgi:hypothetical protein
MKKVIFFILLKLVCFQSFSQTIFWNSPITVALGSTYSNVYPRMTLVTNDEPLITWNHAPSSSIYSSVLIGSTFSTPVKVNPVGLTPVVYTWSGAEIASASDTVIVTFLGVVGPYMKVYTVRSLNGGISYEDTVRVDSYIGNDMGGFPSVGMGLGGNPVVSFMRMDSLMMAPEWVTSRSVDGGLSYLPDVAVSNIDPDEVCDCCPSSIATSGTKHVTLFRNNESNVRTIYAAFSTDESATYPVQTQVDLTNWTIAACPSSGPSAVIVGDTLIHVWRSQNTSKIYIATVNLNDQQIGQHRLLTPFSAGTQNYPVIAAKGDTIAVVWQENYGGGTDVYFTYSLTGVTGLGVTVDTLTKSMTSHQTRPDLAYNNKTFHISCADAMGNDILYLKGVLSTGIGIKEEVFSNEIEFISAYEDGENLVLSIYSSTQKTISFQLINSLGQLEQTVLLKLNEGKNLYSIKKIKVSGIAYLNLYSDSGKKLGGKIIFTK